MHFKPFITLLATCSLVTALTTPDTARLWLAGFYKGLDSQLADDLAKNAVNEPAEPYDPGPAVVEAILRASSQV